MVHKCITLRPRPGTSLVVQQLRVCLPMQGTQARSLVQEDSTCQEAIKPMLLHKRSHHTQPTRHSEEQPHD